MGWAGCACKVPPLNPTETEFWTKEKTNNTGPQAQAQRVDSSFGKFSPVAEIERNFMLSDVPNSLPKDVVRNPIKHITFGIISIRKINIHQAKFDQVSLFILRATLFFFPMVET